MVHVLETLARLEARFENLVPHDSLQVPDALARAFTTSQPAQPLSHISQTKNGLSGRSLAKTLHRYEDSMAPYEILLWPRIHVLIANTGIQAGWDIRCISGIGTPWLIRQDMAKHPLPLPSNHGLSSSVSNCWLDDSSSYRLTSSLTVEQVQEYADAYFETFEVLRPVLDRDAFMTGTVARVMREGYKDGDPGAVLALMVFALGKTAIEGTIGEPISINSGFRGGSAESPPGIEIFCEARRRLGFVGTSCSLENVQIMLLEGTYYEASARYLEFWRCVMAASSACQMLIRCQNFDWSSQEGGMITRAYWACLLSEDLCHIELDLPRTDIHALEDDVPLPYFQGAWSQEDYDVSGNQVRLHCQYHSLAMIALRQLIKRIRDVNHEGRCQVVILIRRMLADLRVASIFQAPGKHIGGSNSAIREMAYQLDQWRSLLPRSFQWLDDDVLKFPHGISTSRQRKGSPLVRERDLIPMGHICNFEVVTASLRTRFYYARYLIFRPFIYKALHSPELLNADDVECCALGVQSACLWSLSMALSRDKKRLIPHLFTWTHNVVSMLLVLRMTQEEGALKWICGEEVDPSDLESTIVLMLDWIKDVKQIDGIAEWSWKIIEPLFERFGK
jgi:hypothetical protein